MEAILIKVFATALALSQVTTRPDAIKTHFDPATDKAEVVQLLGDGCAYLRKAFDIENLDLDDLIETAMTDKAAVAGDVAGFRGLKFGDLHLAYRQFCKNEKISSPVDIGQVIEFYNKAADNLPDHNKMKGLKLPGLTTVLDLKGNAFAELFEPDNRRHWVPLSEIPEFVQQAFIAAEDKRFFQHKGVDERSVIRAFINMLGDPGRRQGGSTITQQVAKNLLVGDDVTYERKIREFIVASRVEKLLTKQEILEAYLNAIYLGRGAWGIELAARSYFNKSTKDLTLAEGAFLAGLARGPNYYNPDRHRERVQERFAYVLGRMQEDSFIDKDQMKAALGERLAIAAYSRPRRETGFHAVDQVGREAKAVAGIESLTSTSYSIRTSIHPQLQWAAEAALQEGLARYEQSSGRARFEGPELSLADQVKRITADPKADKTKPAWRQALEAARLPLYDVHWTAAVVVEKGSAGGRGESIKIGLRDGRVLPLNTWSAEARRKLALHDVVHVKIIEPKGKESARAELRIRPQVQGAVVVLENSTGRILAMVGGFSYPLSQLNRTTQSRRQPGSAFKPMTYLAALASGLQPNTLVQDALITLPPIGGVTRNTLAEDWWTPKNYDGGASGPITLRRALENSKNLVTAQLLSGGIADSPPDSLDQICRLAQEAQLYASCERFYPFVLGAQPVRPVDIAAFYAAIANEGGRPTPHIIDSIEQDGRTIYRASNRQVFLGSADRASVFQLRTMLQGVLARGTARAVAHHWPYIAGKTGTSDDENDAWFVGFSNDVTIAVWVGYDNAKGKRTLGTGQTGGKVSLPIFDTIMQAVWAVHAPKTVLRGPSPDAARFLIALPIDVRSGVRLTGGERGGFLEQFRLDRSGRFVETLYRLVSRENANPVLGMEDLFGNRIATDGYRRDYDGTPFFAVPRFSGATPGYIAPRPRELDDRTPRARRVDPDYFWSTPHRLY
jgi:membrane carboxypeptidase/penicillin-binding protein